MDKDSRKTLNEELAVFFGQLERRIDNRFKEHEAVEAARHNDVMAALDGLANQTQTDEQERVALSSQVDRHEGWIEQLADAANVKLATE